MKKFLYTISAALLITACSNDYTDWAQPQSASEDAASVTLSLTQAPDINLANVTTDSIQLFVPKVESAANAVNSYSAKLFNTDKSAARTLSADAAGRVKTSDLITAVNALYTSRPTQREVPMTVTAYTKINGQSIKNEGNVNVKATPNGPQIAETYYLTGSINAWNYNDKTYEVKNNGGDPYLNPAFSITLTAAQVGTGLQFKLTPASALGKEDHCITATKDNAAGKFAYNNEGEAIKITTVAGVKYYKLDFDMLAQTYTVTTLNDAELFLTGSEYGWGGTWKPMVPVHGTISQLSPSPTFWTIIYLHAGEEFKFAPQAGWGNDFGSQATINDVAGAGATDNSGNIKIANAGWYLLKVVNGTQRTVDILSPDIYLIGGTAGNDWTINPAHRFSVPSDATGEFVSPAFTNNAEVRMCIHLDGFDWWKTEFIVNGGGQIDFRGNGNDQPRVNGTAGQKVHLNFSTGTGSYQ